MLFYLKKSNIASVSKEIIKFDPCIVLITSCTGQINIVSSFLKSLKIFSSKSFVIVGGPHASALPEETLNLHGVDAVCIGEGEIPLKLFMEKYFNGDDYTSTPGLWFKSEKGEVIKNRKQCVINPDDLPFPDRELFVFQNFINSMPDEVGPEFIGSRGCVFSCSYCAAETIHGKGIRYRSPSNLIKEIKSVINRYSGINFIGFHDNVFTYNKDWLYEFCGRYRKEIRIPFWCNTRVDCLTESDIKLLKKSFCRRIHMGIESGSERIRKHILKRNISSQTIINVFDCVKKHGIRAVAFNMIGLPTETEEDIKSTVFLNRVIRPSWIILSVFQPLPGTDIFAFCAKKPGFKAQTAEDYYTCNTILGQPSVSEEKVKYYYENFIRLVYEKTSDIKVVK